MNLRCCCLHLFSIVLLSILPPRFAPADDVALHVTEPTGVDRRDWPVTSGIPLVQGIFRDGQAAVLRDDHGVALPLQTEVLSRWPDGSARWLLLDFALTIQARETRRLTLRCGGGEQTVPVESPVRAVSQPNQLVLDTGPLQVILSRGKFRLLDDVRIDRNNDGEFSEKERLTSSEGAGIVLRAPDGETFTADMAETEAVIEQSGPLRACIRFEGRHASGTNAMFRYVVRIHAFRGQPFLKIHYTFINDYQPSLMARFDSLSLIFRLSDADQATYWLNGASSSPGRLDQIDERSFQIDGQPAGERAHGWLAQFTELGGMAVGVRDFWQNWPKGLEHRPGELQVDLCPDFPAGRYDGKPLEEECRLYYYLRDGQYSFKCGQARTHEVWTAFSAQQAQQEDLARFFRAAESPLLAQCEPEYVQRTQALGPLAATDRDRYADYESLVARFFDLHLADRERFREFGMLNYGDWFNVNWSSWGNLEYDTARNWFQQYLRSGDRRYFDRAEAAARHFADMDILHATHPEIQQFPGTTNMRAGQVWPHLVGHTGGYYGRYSDGKYEGLAPLKMTGAYQIGLWDHGHTWIGGVFDHYLLTGDRRAREVGVLVSDAMAEICPTGYTDHLRVIGWPLHLLLNAYEVTGERRYLLAAGKQWAQLRKHLDPQRGWVVMLAHGHCSEASEAERCRGNNMYMLGLTLTSLARYHRLTQDPEVLAGLTAGIDQMIRETWSEPHKSFFLTSCRHARSQPPEFNSATLHASEAFAYEARVTGNREHQRILRESLQSAITGGIKVLERNEAVGQTGYYSGVFLFPPFALESLHD